MNIRKRALRVIGINSSMVWYSQKRQCFSNYCTNLLYQEKGQKSKTSKYIMVAGSNNNITYPVNLQFNLFTAFTREHSFERGQICTWIKWFRLSGFTPKIKGSIVWFLNHVFIKSCHVLAYILSHEHLNHSYPSQLV